MDRAVKVNSDVLQIFVKNANQWKSPGRPKPEIDLFRQAVIDAKLACVIAHDSYLINLASPVSLRKLMRNEN